MYGVIAPAVAWPTILMPVEYALITQFVAFIFQYFSDARATVRGWLPPWYSTYRFVLTFLAGASIVLSLVGRGQIVKSDIKSTTHGRYVDRSGDPELQALEIEEKERRHAEADAEGEENGEDEPEESKDDNEGADKSEDKREPQKDSKDGSKGDEDKK
jgi:Mg-chelatase subunit ChlI